MTINDEQFSINFWITSDVNPPWSEPKSNIKFVQYANQHPYLTFEKNGNFLIVFRTKGEKELLVKTDITEYLGRKTMISLTFNNGISTLYINGKIVDS